MTELYTHQRKAVEKLKHVKVGALYMEQGTGKTRTALELIDIRLKANKVNHVIWLCPCSVKTNLYNDIVKHIGYMPDYITICGIETLSSSVRANSELLQMVKKYRCYLIVDESNLVKNFFAKRTKNIIRLAEHCKYKLILNGTPIARNEADLFAQWYILDYRILGYRSFWSFSANHIEYDDYGRLRRCLNTDYLSEKIAPFTFQIKKSDCLDLPSKTYETYCYSLNQKQFDLYWDAFHVLMEQVDEFKPETIYKLFTACQDIIAGLEIINYDNLKTRQLFKNYMDNPRMQSLSNVVSNITDKIIIFAKYTFEIDNIVDMLESEYGKGSAVRFDGNVSLKQRNQAIEQFKTSARFLVANKTCAGYGLNLQFCSYVIFYNNDFDYATRAQAEDRVHRIGQNQNVHIIDICADNTLDEQILKCLHRKESLCDNFKSVLKEMNDVAKSISKRKRVRGRTKKT